MVAGIARGVIGVLLGFVLAVATSVRAHADVALDLDRARQLYEQASYPEALGVLDAVSAGVADDAGQFETLTRYRVLCQLALGQGTNAERTLEAFLQRFPTRTVYSDETPPKLAELVRRLRTRMLPALIRSRIAEGRVAFADGRRETARRQFREAIALLSLPEVVTSGEGTTADLRILADGFLTLLDEDRARADARTTFDDGDDDVTPPDIVRQELPRWSETLGRVGPVPRRAMLDIWVAATGDVEKVSLRESLHPHYDGLLLAAARGWKYRPARRDGRPVRYHRVMAITLTPP